MDRAFRSLLHGGEARGKADADADTDTDPEDVAAVQWAVDTARAFAGGDPIEAREEHLRVSVMGMTGTADALCGTRQWSADLKTGEIRDYEAQQAAYALGFMDREFTNRWTVLLLYCDAREVVMLEFSRARAEKIVRGVIARVKDPQARATPCDYCDWCALRWTCRARLEPLSMMVFGNSETLEVSALTEDPARLGAVLSITHEIARDDGLHEVLKQAAKLHLEAGHEVAGWSLTRGRDTQSVNAVTVARYAGELGIGRVTASYGAMSARKFADLWTRAFGDQPIPEGLMQTNHHPSFLSRRRPRSS
jgi:hypothetical protein